MADDFQDVCPQCGAGIPDGTDQCPGCGSQLVFCFNPACSKPFPGKLEVCPFCQTPNEMVDLFREPQQEPPASPASPAVRAAAPLAPATPGPSVPAPGSLGGVAAPGMAALIQAGPAAPVAGPPPEQLAALLAGMARSGTLGPAVPPTPTPLMPALMPGLVPGMPPGMAAMPPMPGMLPGVPGMGMAMGMGMPPNLPAAFMGAPPTLPDVMSAMVPVSGPGTPSVALEVDSSQSARRGQQALLRFRVTAHGGESDVELNVESSFWPTPMRMDAHLMPSETHEFSALKYVPRVAGTEEVKVSVTLRNAARQPVGRWQAAHVLTIEDVAREQTGSIQADVVILGGQGMPLPGLGGAMPGFPGLPGLPGMPGMGMPGMGLGWQSLPLRPDGAFMRRLASVCPEAEVHPPPLPGPAVPRLPGTNTPMLIHLRDEASRRQWAVAAVCGTAASLGRGGDAGVDWWLQPAPYDATQHRRLSRLHTLLQLRDGRAWATDRSTNGTLLNDQPLAKDQPEQLAQGDQLNPARVVPFRVTLQAVQGRVCAVWLERRDSLAAQLSYVLTDGQTPVRLSLASEDLTPLWVAWTASPAALPVLAILYGDQGSWTFVESDREQPFAGRFRVRWQALAQAQPQEYALRHPWMMP